MTESPDLSLAELIEQADLAKRRFYADLESELKRHDAMEFAMVASRRLKSLHTNPDGMAQTPPHWLLHAIEASCAYARGHRNEPVTRNRLARIINVYHNNPDHLQLHAAATNLILFGLLLFREQMELQQAGPKEAVARPLALFAKHPSMERVDRTFAARFGLSMRQWIRLCFASFAAASLDDANRWRKDQISNSALLRVSPQGIDAFFRLSAVSPADIKVRYRKDRTDLPPRYHGLIRSVFFERPILDFGDSRLLCPVPELLLRHCGQGLYRACTTLPGFYEAFSKSFEAYVEAVLESCSSGSRLLGPRELERLVPGKTCDFLLELPDVILLVEGKATTYSARLLTEKAIEGDGSTSKIARAIVQLYSTASRVLDGALTPAGIATSKPMVGVVVTFGNMPFVNSDWYFDVAFSRRTADVLKSRTQFLTRPAIMPIHILERLVRVLNSSTFSLTELIREKEARPYVLRGDWDAYLESKLREMPNPSPLKLLEHAIDELMEDFRSAAQSSE